MERTICHYDALRLKKFARMCKVELSGTVQRPQK